MPLSSTYQILKLKLGPQDKSGTEEERKRRRRTHKYQTTTALVLSGYTQYYFNRMLLKVTHSSAFLI